MQWRGSASWVPASVAAVLAPPVIVVAGIVPRVSPLRAIMLGLSSRLFLRANPVSQRTQKLAELRAAMPSRSRHKELYSVVMGPKGVGKTCAVDTATEVTLGVVSVVIPPGTSHNTILFEVFTAITNTNPRAVVLWWHHFLFRTHATVVPRAERKPTEAVAALDSAARELAHDYDLRVIIDASDNSLPAPEDAKATMREMVVQVGPMTRSVLESVPDLAELLSALKAADLADVVWTCVGGVQQDTFNSLRCGNSLAVCVGATLRLW